MRTAPLILILALPACARAAFDAAEREPEMVRFKAAALLGCDEDSVTVTKTAQIDDTRTVYRASARGQFVDYRCTLTEDVTPRGAVGRPVTYCKRQPAALSP